MFQLFLLISYSLKAFLISWQEFLKKEFSEENILFWIACENFRNLTNFEQVIILF